MAVTFSENFDKTSESIDLVTQGLNIFADQLETQIDKTERIAGQESNQGMVIRDEVVTRTIDSQISIDNQQLNVRIILPIGENSLDKNTAKQMLIGLRSLTEAQNVETDNQGIKIYHKVTTQDYALDIRSLVTETGRNTISIDIVSKDEDLVIELITKQKDLENFQKRNILFRTFTSLRVRGGYVQKLEDDILALKKLISKKRRDRAASSSEDNTYFIGDEEVIAGNNLLGDDGEFKDDIEDWIDNENRNLRNREP